MDLLDRLAKEFSQDTILFVGSGVSVPAGLPSWWMLVSWLRDYTLKMGGNVEAANIFLKEEDLIKATSALTNELGEQGKSLKDFFNEDEKCVIFRTAEPQQIHKLIANLPTYSLITPNYDLLLEKTYEMQGREIQVVHKAEKESLNQIKRNKLKDYIYKYHGCITRPENIVLDYKQYNAEIHGLSVDTECLKNLIQSKTFIFIGAGLEDPDFNQIRDYLIQINDAESIEFWAFMKNCEGKVDFFKKEFGINLVNYIGEGNDHSDLLNKLQALITKINIVDERKRDDIKLAIPLVDDPVIKIGGLRQTLLQANEEIIPLDKQILGFVSFFDSVDKNHLFQFMIEFKGNEEDVVLNRIEFLVKQKLMKETDNFFLPLRASFAIEAAILVEDDIMEFLMEREHG
jgi:hypothetical protein